MSETWTTPDDWLLTHHARDAGICAGSKLSSFGLQKDHSVPIDTLFRSRCKPTSKTSASASQKQQRDRDRSQTKKNIIPSYNDPAALTLH